ncbi:MAG: histidinol dehydrogenase [Brevibacterium sp.]|nr:histidinol dehydrogenase [Brevibacterium sp.]
MASHIIRWSTSSAERRRAVLTRNNCATGTGGSNQLTEGIRSLIDDVQDRGDSALVDALQKFDSVDTPNLRVSAEDFVAAENAISDELSAAIDVSIERIRAFNNEIVARASWNTTTADGTVLGEIARPLESVGLFVPSGKGAFPSVLLQTGVPAITAGVTDIQVVVPPVPGSGGQVDPATLVVASRLGITDVYCLNGPSGIAALALGTETVRPVRKIVGPGSPPVALAQQLVQTFGVSIVGGLGPTDSLVIADETAEVRYLAADVINEAEHGPDSSAVLVSPNRVLLEATEAEILRQLSQLPQPRRDYAMTSIFTNGGLIVADSMPQALEIANDYAAEHIQFATADPRGLLEQLRFAGTALLGQHTTFAGSNFVIGTPATLPTTGFAKQNSGVTAHTYLNIISTAEVDEKVASSLGPAIMAFADYEGFPAHGRSVTVRSDPASSAPASTEETFR